MWSGVPPEGAKPVGRPSRRSGSGRETLPKVLNRSGDLPRSPEVKVELSRKFGSGRETLPVVRRWSGDPPGGLKVVGRPSRRFGSG